MNFPLTRRVSLSHKNSVGDSPTHAEGDNVITLYVLSLCWHQQLCLFCTYTCLCLCLCVCPCVFWICAGIGSCVYFILHRASLPLSSSLFPLKTHSEMETQSSVSLSLNWLFNMLFMKFELHWRFKKSVIQKSYVLLICDVLFLAWLMLRQEINKHTYLVWNHHWQCRPPQYHRWCEKCKMSD